MRLKPVVMSLFVGLIMANQNTMAANTDGLHLDWRDTTVSPQDNFYNYANGNWIKNNPIPPEYAGWGSFSALQEKVQKVIHQLVIQAANDKQAKPGSIEQKVGDFYYSGMDEALINKVGVSPLKQEFDQIENIKTKADLEETLIHLHLIGVGALFNFGSMQDFKDSKDVIAAAMQGGLSLPDRDYYLKDDKKFKALREAYLDHLNKMFILLGDKPEQAQKAAETVMSIETMLAKASLTQVEQRDPHAIYHMMTLAETDKITPSFSWQNYLKGMGLNQVKAINVGMPDFFKAMNKALDERPIEDWKTYLRWQLIDSYAPYLSTPFVDQNFHMNSILTGTKEQLPRWKRVINTENGALGFAIGKLYVEKYFPPSSKEKATTILKNIRQVLRNDLQNLPWMEPATREAAIKKLDQMEDRIGYPDKWRDYSTLTIDRGPYVLNVLHANKFLTQFDLNKIGKPVDRGEWAMTPQTINAYYDPSMNNLNIPAAILQGPFFDPDAPAAVNYGAIGFVMGHEMTHGFDDQGAQFDGEGNLKDWWTPNDLKKFQAATQCIVDQFSQYKVGDLNVQGKLVVGEATADLGGLTLAHRAFLRSSDYKNASIIDGFTPEQQFFLGTAHVWAGHVRPEQARNLIMTDPHPPMLYRVNGTLANMPAFIKAYQIGNDSPMKNKKTCEIW